MCCCCCVGVEGPWWRPTPWHPAQLCSILNLWPTSSKRKKKRDSLSLLKRGCAYSLNGIADAMIAPTVASSQKKKNFFDYDQKTKSTFFLFVLGNQPVHSTHTNPSRLLHTHYWTLWGGLPVQRRFRGRCVWRRNHQQTTKEEEEEKKGLPLHSAVI